MKEGPSTTSSTGGSEGAPARSAELLARVDRIPATPGVYLLQDSRGRIIYIGKAVNLRSRVKSYFQRGSDGRIFHQFISDRAADVDCIVTASEAEALILENNLIKKHRPTFNIRLKDDKTYVSLKVTLAEEWPRVLVVRRWKDDGSLYFGPYSSAGAVREVLRVIKTVFPLRTCSSSFFKGRSRACMEHEIGRCAGPCVGLISREKYLESVSEVILFLKGKNQDLLERLHRKMEEASEGRRYELAARYRDQVRAIEKVFQAQKAQGFRTRELDAFGCHRQGDRLGIQELSIRDGKIVHSHCHAFRTALPSAEALGSFLAQFYLGERAIPRLVLLPEDIPDRALLESSLRERLGRPVRIEVPRRGEKRRLVEMARSNAENDFRMERDREERMAHLIESLGEKLGLPAPPRAIECFDISNFQGALAVGAMVRFEDGEPVKDRYRKFRIRTVAGADDFRMMREVLERRMVRGMAEGDLPDLLLIDGGKGQLGVATGLLRELGLSSPRAAALAKERRARGTEERVFVLERPDPLPLASDSPESLYLQRIRDEAHRFAVRYHRELRQRRSLLTGLEGIPGIGKARRRVLLDRFHTLEGIRAAAPGEIAELVGPKLAARVLAGLAEK